MIIIVVGITFPELPGIFVKFAVILAELLPILKIALLLKFNVTALALIGGLVNCLIVCCTVNNPVVDKFPAFILPLKVVELETIKFPAMFTLLESNITEVLPNTKLVGIIADVPLVNNRTSITSDDNGVSVNVIKFPVTEYYLLGCCTVPLIFTITPALEEDANNE